MNKRTQKQIDRAIAIAGGSQAKLAALTGFSQYTIWKAQAKGVCTPALAAAIERATQGIIKRWEVCSTPDVFSGLGLFEEPDPSLARAS